MHDPALVHTTPTTHPYLEITRRDTGEVRWFAGAPDGQRLFARLLDLMWGGPDGVEVTAWSVADDTGGRGRSPSGWVVETFSATSGACTFDVRLCGVGATLAATIRQQLAALGSDPNTEPSTLTHLLCRSFLTMADEFDVQVADDAPFELSLDCQVIGPWAPAGEMFELVERAPSPFDVTFRWFLDPSLSDGLAQNALIDFVRTSFKDPTEFYSLSIFHNLPSVERDGEDLRVLRRGLEQLSHDGWRIIDEGAEWPHVLDGPPNLRIELDVTLELAAEDDYEEYNAENEPEDLEIEFKGDFVVGVPLPRPFLDDVEELMVAGTAPDDALLAVTGSVTLPRPG